MASRCSWCSAIVGVEPNASCPGHQEQGKRTTCPGGGKPTTKV